MRDTKNPVSGGNRDGADTAECATTTEGIMADAQSNVIDFTQEIPQAIPPGSYELAFDYFEVRTTVPRVSKLVLWFKVMGPKHMGTSVPQYFNLPTRRKQGKGRGAPFAVGRHSEFLRQYVQVFGDVPRRLDRIPMTRFNNQIFRADVRLVTKNQRQKLIPKPLQYNVVNELKALTNPSGGLC